MGYTHYWDSKKIPQKNFDKIKSKVKIAEEYIEEQIGIQIHDGLGQERGVDFKENEIRFNGCNSEDLDYETFHLENKKTFAFCKTARRPYDLMCMVVILIGFVNKQLTFSSDGSYGTGEWEDGVELYNIIAKKNNWSIVKYCEEEGYLVEEIVDDFEYYV